MVAVKAVLTLLLERAATVAATLVTRVDEAVMVPLTDHGIMVEQALAAIQVMAPVLTVVPAVLRHLQDQVAAQQVVTTQAPTVYQLAVAWDYLAAVQTVPQVVSFLVEVEDRVVNKAEAVKLLDKVARE
jgi:hypothetical protein